MKPSSGSIHSHEYSVQTRRRMDREERDKKGEAYGRKERYVIRVYACICDIFECKIVLYIFVHFS